MDERCETCQHWTCEVEYDPFDLAGWGACTLTDYWAKHRPNSRAFALGYDNAILRTLPDFGCVQWQHKADT